MAIKASEFVWHNGHLIPWDEAKIHVMAHVVNYGSSVFEGIRCYHTPKGPAIFRLRDHTLRLLQSCKIYRIDVDYSLDELYQGDGRSGCGQQRSRPATFAPSCCAATGRLASIPSTRPPRFTLPTTNGASIWAAADSEDGVDVCVSSWTRLAPNTMPTMAKAGANYMNSQLIKMEAIVNGYSEGIALDVNGYVSEGSGENIFVVHKDRIYTPPLGNSVLPGITRNSVLHIAHELGIPVIEQIIPREMLYIADELFFSGTAAEITPIRSVDKITVGHGTCWSRHQDASARNFTGS